MRVLFASWAWPTHLLPLVPLAWAFRAAGHEVLVATQPPQVGTVTGAGLPAVAVGSHLDLADYLGSALRPLPARTPATGPTTAPTPAPVPRRRLGLSVRVAEDMVADLVDLCASWRPSLILHEPTSYAAILAATVAGVPHVPVLWGIDFHAQARAFEQEAFADLCRTVGIGGFDSTGLVTVDPCPPSLQIADDRPRLRMRHIPYNGSAVLPHWLHRAEPAERICLCLGMSPYLAANAADAALITARLVALAGELAGLGPEVVLAVPSAASLGPAPLPPGVRVVERLPLHTILPSCGLLITRGGAGSMLTGVAAGVPQLCLPQFTTDLIPSQRLTDTGAGEFVEEADSDPEAVVRTAERILRTPSYRQAAVRLREETEGQPALAQVVGDVIAMTEGPVRPVKGF